MRYRCQIHVLTDRRVRSSFPEGVSEIEADREVYSCTIISDEGPRRIHAMYIVDKRKFCAFGPDLIEKPKGSTLLRLSCMERLSTGGTGEIDVHFS